MSRLAIDKVAPAAYRAVYGMEKYCQENVEPTLYKLIKLRASIVNGCSFSRIVLPTAAASPPPTSPPTT